MRGGDVENENRNEQRKRGKENEKKLENEEKLEVWEESSGGETRDVKRYAKWKARIHKYNY